MRKNEGDVYGREEDNLGIRGRAYIYFTTRCTATEENKNHDYDGVVNMHVENGTSNSCVGTTVCTNSRGTSFKP